jgi:hypothetical protein
MRIAVLVIAGVLATTEAHAQVAFPPESTFIAMRCGGGVMTDRRGDDPAALAELDLVGNAAEPAGLRSGDADHLYLRIRIDTTPVLPGGGLLPGAWGMAFDLDGDVQTYELLALVDAITAGAPQVRLYENRTVTTPNDPTEPADSPAVATYPFDANGRFIPTGSKIGGDTDFFVDFALPWADLRTLGLDRTTPVFVWVASSNAADALTLDFACHDRGGGAPVLDQIVTDQTVGDPTVDTDEDGFTDAEEIENGSDPSDPNSVPPSRLEGGGGCRVAGPADVGAVIVLLAFVGKRRRTRSG